MTSGEKVLEATPPLDELKITFSTSNDVHFHIGAKQLQPCIPTENILQFQLQVIERVLLLCFSVIYILSQTDYMTCIAIEYCPFILQRVLDVAHFSVSEGCVGASVCHWVGQCVSDCL